MLLGLTHRRSPRRACCCRRDFRDRAAFVLPFAPPVTASRAGVDPAEATFAPLVVPVAGADATVPLAFPEGPLVAGGGVSGA